MGNLLSIATPTEVVSFFIKVLEIHYSKNKSKQYLAQLLKVNPYFLNDYIMAAQNYSSTQIEKIIKILHDADLKVKNIKSPQISPNQQIKELVAKIMS